MKSMYNTRERQEIIDRMVAIARHDAPWVWSFFPQEFTLHHAWVANRKPHPIANNGLKYQRIDPVLRDRSRREWNRPVVWPAALGAGFLVLFLAPAVATYRRRERQKARPDSR
jgi:hypothetical protein